MSKTKETRSYYQRWFDLTIELIKHKGRVHTIGFLAGILARRTQVDYDLKRVLGELEDRYSSNSSKEAHS